MEKNEVYTVTCTGYSEDGAGVVRIGSFVLFVPGLLEGEEAEIGITALKKNYGYGRVIRILKRSPHRCDPVCSVYRLCGGCQLQHMDHEEQERFKREKVRLCFKNNAGLDIVPDPVRTAEPFRNYRNKVQVPVQQKDGKIRMGFYRLHSNDIIDYENCAVQTDLSNELTMYIKELIQKYRLGNVMRHVLVKHAHNTGQVMVVFVVRKYPDPGLEKLTERIVRQYPAVRSVSAILNKREDNVILDGKQYLLHGELYIEEILLGCRFRISARSFFQINPYTTPLLYETALEYAQLSGKETVIDLYCGTGTIGIIAASRAKKVYGIEVVGDAVKDAEKNAEMNQVRNIQFLNMDAGQGAQAVIRSKIKADVVIVDPPRKGCSKETLNAIEKIAPERLVYVSCDPATLARDVKIMAEKGYHLEKVTPFDMFPQSVHVETVVLMSRIKD